MHHLTMWTHQLLAAAPSEPTIIDQAPAYGGLTTTVFYLAGGILVIGALVLWGIYQVRNRGK